MLNNIIFQSYYYAYYWYYGERFLREGDIE
jgi:hypothetical protein